MKQKIKLLVLSREWSDGKVMVQVGTLFPSKEVFGEAVYSGNAVSANSFEVLLRRADKLAGHRARRTLAKRLSEQ